MNRTTIYARTAKGDRAIAVLGELPPHLGRILNAIDGASPVADLLINLYYLPPAEIEDGLNKLTADDYIRDSGRSASGAASGAVSASASASESAKAEIDEHARKAQALRAKIRDRRQSGDHSRSTPEADPSYQARAEAEEKAENEAAERVRQEAEEQARRLAAESARRDAEDEVRKAAERDRREAEEWARQQAEEESRREAAERARQEAEEQARRDAEEEARKAAERVRQDAAETARREAAEEGEREAAEHVRQRAEVQARLLAEEQAWLEEEETKRREEEKALERELAKAGAAAPSGKDRSKMPRKWGKPLAKGVGFLLVLGLVAIHLISFDGQIPQFEKALSAQFQQPVKIKALHLALVPQPHLRLEGVSIGGQGQIKLPRIKAAGDLVGNLFGDAKVFKSIELDSPVVTDEGLGWILFGDRGARNMPFGEVSVLNASLDSKTLSLPPFDAKIQPEGEGAWKTISIASVDKNLNLELTAKGRSVQIEAKALSFKLPFGSALTLDEFVANGTADRGGLVVTEFKGFVYGGTLSGSARLKWGANWSLAGELNAKQIDTARLIPELMESSRVAGTASYTMQAPEAAKLFPAARVEGSFAIPRGTLRDMDLGSVLQGGNVRGNTQFSELAGSFVYDRGAIHLSQVRLSQSNMSANGSLDVDAENNVRGRFAAEIRLSTEQRRANLAISGNLGKLEWQRQ